MEDFVSKVLTFNRIAGNIGEFDAKKVALYIGLQLEEVVELLQSVPVDPENVEYYATLVELENLSKRFKRNEISEVQDIDRKEALDAFCDVAVIAIGGANVLGSNVEGALHAVADNNLSKFPIVDGEYTVLRDENGKIRKPDGYVSVDLEPYVNGPTSKIVSFSGKGRML